MEGPAAHCHRYGEAQGILGDFNAVLYLGDRVGGTEEQQSKVQSFGDCINACELQELRSNGLYFTWQTK